jgi:hypothetical protein
MCMMVRVETKIFAKITCLGEAIVTNKVPVPYSTEVLPDHYVTTSSVLKILADHMSRDFRENFHFNPNDCM